MGKINIMFFGNSITRVNSVLLSNALDELSLKNPIFYSTREYCIQLDEIFYDLRYGFSYNDLKLGNVSFHKGKKAYKFPLLNEGNKIGMVLIDEFGETQIIFDKLKAMEIDTFQLESHIQILISSNKLEIIDNVMTMLQYTRPIPLNQESFLLYIDEDDKKDILDFFDSLSIYQYPFKPSFLTIEDEGDNYRELASILSEKIEEVLIAFENTKEDFFYGTNDDITYEDLEVVESLIEFTKSDAKFYEDILGLEILNKLNFNFDDLYI